jgi:hypothetical protein
VTPKNSVFKKKIGCKFVNDKLKNLEKIAKLLKPQNSPPQKIKNKNGHNYMHA